MKKLRLILFTAAATIVLLAVTLVVVWTARDARRAADEQAAVYAAYQQLREHAASYTVTVTENGVAVGAYTLEELGVLDDTLSALDAQFSATERLTPEEFEALPLREKLDWHDVSHPSDVSVPLAMDTFNPAPVLRDLNAVAREPAQDAYLSFSDGAYQIHPEVPGTVVQEEPVQDALTEFAAALVLSEEAEDATFELTDCDCYVPPEITVENAGFDFARELAEDLQDMTVTVTFHNAEETLSGETLAALLSAGSDGKLSVDGAALDTLISGWAETYQEFDTPYLFSSYKGGVVPIDFLPCDYDIDTAALRKALEQQLLSLTSGAISAPYFCYDKNGEPFAIAKTYVEVDIENQHLAYYQDGELLVNTDVVTGKLDGHRTPKGLYSSYDKQVNRWLVGEDYCVFVKYWVRISGPYGLHDASWRTKFGGEYYKYGGSHGCVNIPEEAMAVIYEHIEDGTPVLVH